MNSPIVSLTVDSGCATAARCYVSELVSVAERYRVPFTWLIKIEEHNPLENVRLYHNEYIHRIPAWHELGLMIEFDSSPHSSMDRGDVIRMAKDVMKQYSIKPTSYRAASGDLEASDIEALTDIGIVVDSTPGSCSSRPNGAPAVPYHPSQISVQAEGNSGMWIVPVANIDGVRAYLDDGFEKIKSVIDSHLANSHHLCLGLCDCKDNAYAVEQAIAYLRTRGSRFVTLTQMSSELLG